MSSLLKTLLDRWYPTKGLTVAIFGESWSGKSSVVAVATGTGTVPYGNMGFIYRAVEAPTSTGKPLTFEACDIGLGCGSVSRMGVLYAGLVSWTDAMIWVVDSSRREDLNASVSALMMIMGAVEEKRRETKKLKTKLPVLILANKQDVPEAMSVDEIRQAFKYFTKHYTSIVLPTSLVGPYGSSGLQHGMDWLEVMLDNPSLLSKIGSLPKPQGEEKEIPKYPKDLINKIESWVVRLDKDVSDGEFIRLFEIFELPSWDHYTHIRVAYLLITIHGRQKGKAMIFDGLKAYIEQNRNTSRAFHFTMTYFWIQIVHLGIQNVASRGTSKAEKETSSTLSSPEKDEFAHFLLLNPYVADGVLWSNYYTLEHLMSPTAKTSMDLPDKKRLPNLVVRDAI